MNLEDRLRDELGRAAGGSAEPPNWAAIRDRAFARRRRRRALAYPLVGLVAVALIVGSVVAVASVRTGDDGDSSVTAGPTSAAPPKEIVAATEDGRLVVLATEDGRELRHLAGGAATVAGAGSDVQVSPDGRTVYFTRDLDVMCGTTGRPVTEVARVDVATSAVETVIGGVHYPALSPDGRRLAFTGVPDCSDGGRMIFVQDLEKGGTQEFETGLPLSAGGIGFLSWAPDSRHLTYTLFTQTEGSFPRAIDTQTGTSLDEPERIFNWDGSRIQAFLGDTGQFLGTRCAGGTDPVQDVAVVTFDGSGAISRALFRLPEECVGQTVAADASGRHVLAIGLDLQTLYRWSEGDREPTKVAEGIAAAAWLPGSAAPVDEVPVPDVSGLEPNAARRDLERAGFVVDVTYRTDRDDPGRVADQEPAPGTRTAEGSEVEIVVDMFEGCGGFLSGSALPAGFDDSSRPGPAPEGVPEDPLLGEAAATVHYTDRAGRSIEIRRPANASAISYRLTREPDAYVLGQPVLFTPLDPETGEPLVAQFFFGDQSVVDPCTSYSVNGYGVTEAELAAFAESLVPTP